MRTIILAVFSFFVVTSNAFSDQIPLKYQGYWSGKSCKFSIEQYALFVGTNGYIYENDTQVEFNFVFPQPNFNPKTFVNYDFDHYYIQPMDGNHYHKNEKISKEFINDNPNWKLSLQTHKILGFP